MNSDDKIIKILEDLQAGQKNLEEGQKALQADVQRQGKDIASLRAGQEWQGEQLTQVSREVSKIPAIEKQLDQHNKLITELADNMATFLTEQQAQRIDIRSLHTEVHAAKDELKSEILSARSEAKADNMDLKATVVRQLKDHEKRIDALEEEVGIPHPDKN
jgi:cell division septum initiation protein DivIVA